MKDKSNNIGFINHWVQINNMLTRQKYLSLASFCLSALLGVCLIASALRAPIVAITDGSESLYIAAKRQPTSIGKNDIIESVRKFISLRYEWDKLDPNQIVSSIQPLCTEGMNDKILSSLEKEKKEFGENLVEQYVANLKVQVTDKAINATFHRVIVIVGAPIAAKTSLSIQMVHGKQNHWNPAGLYVNGVTIHEGGK